MGFLTVSEAGLVECWSGLRALVVSRENVSLAFSKSIDRSTIVTYTPQVNPPRDGEHHFLHLRAGALDGEAATSSLPCILPETSSGCRPRRRLKSETPPGLAPLSARTAGTPRLLSQHSDDDAVESAVTTHVGEQLLRSLNQEVSLAMSISYAQSSFSAPCGVFSCSLCPFRLWNGSPRQVLHHMRKYHVSTRQYVCSGTKQMRALSHSHLHGCTVMSPHAVMASNFSSVLSTRTRVQVIQAMHDADVLTGGFCGDYLSRSAEFIRGTVFPALSGACNSVDKGIRLVLDAGGPVYMNAFSLGHEAFSSHSTRVAQHPHAIRPAWLTMLLQCGTCLWIHSCLAPPPQKKKKNKKK